MHRRCWRPEPTCLPLLPTCLPRPTSNRAQSPFNICSQETDVNNRNQQLFDRAQRHVPGGVNSPVRAFRSVGGTPCFFASGRGSRVTDVNGKTYLDYVGSWGPLILGHAHPE